MAPIRHDQYLYYTKNEFEIAEYIGKAWHNDRCWAALIPLQTCVKHTRNKIIHIPIDRLVEWVPFIPDPEQISYWELQKAYAKEE